MAGGGEQCCSFYSVVNVWTSWVSLCASVHTLSHHRSHFLSPICSCKSWKHQFIITGQTLLEPVRLCLAVELDFPACKAGMDEHEVAQCILERMFCQWFPTHCVSRSPLCLLRGISSRAGEAGMTALPSGKAAGKRKSCATKGVMMKPGSWSSLTQRAQGCLSHLFISGTWETTKPYTQQWICRTIFFDLPSSSEFA